MPIELLRTPIGAGKTEYTLQQLQQAVENKPFAPIWVLLPGRRQEDALRQQLVESARQRRVFFNITFFNFYSLYARLLDMAGKPQRELDDTARLWLIGGLLADMQRQHELTIFHQIAGKTGFGRVIADFIYELKQNVIYPDAFAKTAATRTDKDRDLARIYDRYQQVLRQNNLIDREGEGWLALDEIGAKAEIGQNISLLMVDGFDQFNPLQMQLLALLASRVQKTVITLPFVQGRETTIGRRFEEAYSKLTTALSNNKLPFSIKTLQTFTGQQRHEQLDHLITHCFTPTPIVTNSNGCIDLLETPSPLLEAFGIMRQVKRLLLDGSATEEILIAVRDWERYGQHLNNASQQYGIPTVMHYGDSLGNNPAVIALLNLLELARFDFRRRDVMDVLRSPYFRIPNLDSGQVEQLDTISQEQFVIKGRQDWMDAIQATAVSKMDEDGERLGATLSTDESQRLQDGLSAFFDAVTPPSSGTIHDYVAWLETLLGQDTNSNPDNEALEWYDSGYTLNTIECLRYAGEPFTSRDLIALQGVKRVLRGLLTTQRLFAVLELSQSETVTWDVFLSDLKAAIGSSSVGNATNRSGHVLITTVSDARGLPHDHVFIPGLSEGIFPQPVQENPIYLDNERAALHEAGIRLETQAERAADEGLFFELISLPRKKLYLSRPTVQNGAIWPESHLWRAVKAIFSDAGSMIEHNRIAPGKVMKPEDAANRNEAALAVAEHLSLGKKPSAAVNGLHQWLETHHSDHWKHIIHNRQTEYDRQTSKVLDHYSGRLQQPEMIEWVKGELGHKRIWSASQFNDYGMCGFRFFAKRLLKLEEIVEPETGMDAAQRGTLIHAILEGTYRTLARRGLSITPEHMGDALDILGAVAKPILADAPSLYGFRASVLWEQEQATLMRRVEALVRADFSDESPMGKAFAGERFPYMQEVPLGGADSVPLQISIGGEVLNVTGYIDRIDRIGDQIIVVDYKTGSTPIPTKEMAEGRNFQMMLYLLAGQAILNREQERDASAPVTVGGGTFWHLNKKTTGTIHMDNVDDQESLNSAQRKLNEHLKQGQTGNFASIPNKKGSGACSHYCEFTQLCRVNIMNRQKHA